MILLGVELGQKVVIVPGQLTLQVIQSSLRRVEGLPSVADLFRDIFRQHVLQHYPLRLVWDHAAVAIPGLLPMPQVNT